MATDVERSHLHKSSSRGNCYSPDLLPLLQTVLSDLADIDLAHEKRLDAIKHSSADDECKSQMITRLWHEHRERRAPYIQELIALKERIEASFD
ncbi:hypothetical protein [Microvirga sp. CF3016]|uniref:hypothetical protein n=1 Tax=Microvirga sp. CF3016 TaxID=3110181 RepID=UPI002E7927CF|nr:hypothetical protein [Microvirga sp. CF3016]MEE1612092.1 hypothetical protein [Microvirga sp. CF3016]